MKQYLSDSGLSLYYSLIDSQTISVTHSPLTIDEEVLCDFTELKSKAESFCQALYNDIERLFPVFLRHGNCAVVASERIRAKPNQNI